MHVGPNPLISGDVFGKNRKVTVVKVPGTMQVEQPWPPRQPGSARQL